MRSTRSIICLIVFLTLPSFGNAQWSPSVPTQLRQPSLGLGNQPHPAVCRIVAPERDGVAFGSGTLVAVEGKFGLIVTNWHVVSDSTGPLSVKFSDGFQSGATLLDSDQDWDLAALLIWKPNATPVRIATRPPQRNDVLKIAGFGSGTYRELTGRCTQYVSPGGNLPFEMVELTGEARQGDSGGPIFNEHGELAGVLFGAGDGITAGSYAGRVNQFLAAVTGQNQSPAETEVESKAPESDDRELIAQSEPVNPSYVETTPVQPSPVATIVQPSTATPIERVETPQPVRVSPMPQPIVVNESPLPVPSLAPPEPKWHWIVGNSPYDHLKTLFAAIGLLGVLWKIWRWLD